MAKLPIVGAGEADLNAIKALLGIPTPTAHRIVRMLDAERLLQRGKRDHEQLLEFLRANDTEGAVQWLHSHLETVCEELVAFMSEDSPPAS